jgi:hypothetical protein
MTRFCPGSPGVFAFVKLLRLAKFTRGHHASAI